jgi:mycothiol synthase
MEKTKKALVLLYPVNEKIQDKEMPEGYRLRHYVDTDKVEYLRLIDSEGWKLNEEQFKTFYNLIIPKGFFIIEDVDSGNIVSTAVALHNPDCSHYYFPFGGDIGFVVTQPEHRGKGLGYIATLAATKRLINGQYTSIRVVTNDHRTAAIKTYLNAGCLPFLYNIDMEIRWEIICNQLDWPFEPGKWINTH